MPWSAAPMAYSPIRPKSQISNAGHDGALSIRNIILMVNKLKNPNIEPLSSIGPYWPSSGQSPKFLMEGMMVLYRLGILYKKANTRTTTISS
jgi:hypothetical protein